MFCYFTATVKFEQANYIIAENNELVHSSVILQASDPLEDNSITVEVTTFYGTATGKCDTIIHTIKINNLFLLLACII